MYNRKYGYYNSYRSIDIQIVVVVSTVVTLSVVLGAAISTGIRNDIQLTITISALGR